MKKRKTFWIWGLSILLLADLTWSFFQYSNEPLDGDIAPIVLPAPHYAPVFEDPLGIDVISGGEKYGGTNRFSVHFLMSQYFKTIPIVLQTFFEPIESVYYACGFFKLFVHFSLLILLAVYIRIALKSVGKQLSDTFEVSDNSTFILLLVLLTPLFNATEYTLYMGVINPSVTYTFFYPFPLIFLMIFFLPFYKKLMMGGRKIPTVETMGWAGFLNHGFNRRTAPKHLIFTLLLIGLAFSGVLVAPIVLIICPMILAYLLSRKIKKSDGQKSFISVLSEIPKTFLFYFSIFIILCLYSLYLGTFNIESSKAVPLSERYIQLGVGIFRQLTRKLGIPLLLGCIFLNIYLIKKQKSRPKKLLSLFNWTAVFCLIYMFLLPLGGYRDYRPNILRADTFLPVTLCLMFMFGSSTAFLRNKISEKRKHFYHIGIGVVLVIFMLADPPNFSNADCEKSALSELSESDEKIIHLKQDCTVMLWEKAHYPKYSKYTCRLLYEWGILKENQLFVQD